MKGMRHVRKSWINFRFYNIRNDFDDISFGSNDKYGICGATPSEDLQIFHLGICDYLYQGFITKLSGDTRKKI